MNYIIINGSGGVGKDTFCQYVGDILNLIGKEYFNFSTIDYVKEAAKRIGWNGVKDDKGRKFLSDVKAALIAYDDIPFKKTIEFTSDFENIYFQSYKIYPLGIGFIHCREASEIKRLSDFLHAKTLLVVRNDVSIISTNPSDSGVLDISYDYVIDNSGTKEDLELLAGTFVEQELHIIL